MSAALACIARSLLFGLLVLAGLGAALFVGALVDLALRL